MIAQGDGTNCPTNIPGIGRIRGNRIAELIDYVRRCPKASHGELVEKYAQGCLKEHRSSAKAANPKNDIVYYRKQYNRLVRSYDLDLYPSFPTCFFLDNTYFLDQYEQLFEENCSHSLKEAGDLIASMTSFTKTHIILLLSFYDSVPVLFGFNNATSQIIEEMLITLEKRFAQLVDTGDSGNLDDEPFFSLISAHSPQSHCYYPNEAIIGKRFQNAFQLRSLPLKERRSLLSDVFIDMKAVDLTQVPDEKLLLVFCVGYRWSTVAI